MKISLQYILACLTLLCISIVDAQIDTVHFRMPDSLGKRGIAYSYPIYCNDSLQSADSVLSGEFTYASNAVFTVTGIDTAGTMLSGKNVLFSAATQKIVFASAQPITGKGVLIYLKIIVNMGAQPGVTQPVSLLTAMLNEGKPSVAVKNGSFRPMDIFINPKNAPQNKVVGDTILFSATGDVTLPLFWTVGDTSIASIDSTGRFIGRKIGQTFSKVTDSYGLTDQSNLIPINSPALNSLTMTIRDTSFMQNLTFDLPIRISDVTLLGIISAQWRLTFNTNTLVPLAVLTTGTIAQSWGTPTANFGSGTIDIAMAGSDTLTGQGILAYVRFQVKRFAVQSSALNLQNVLFNENIGATLKNGIFNPIAGPTITITPNVKILTRGDTITYAASGGKSPYKWFSSDTSIAIVDSLSGKVRAKAKGLFTLSVFDVQGFDAGLSISINNMLASLPDTTVAVGDSVDVPITVSDVTGLGVLSTQIKIGYDTTKVQFSQLITTGVLSSGMQSAFNDSGSVIRMAFSGTIPLSGNGVFAKLRFHHKAPAGSGQFSLLTFLEYQNNEPGPLQPTATLRNGRITIIAPLNSNPVFTNAMGDTTIKEDQLLTFAYNASDPDADQVKFFLQNQPSGMTIDSISGTLNWRPNFTQAGINNFTVTAQDGKGGSTSKQTKITVQNVSRSPQFTKVMGDTSINEGQQLTFDYNGVDLDNDPIKFSLQNAPQGMTIDSISGILTWKPSFTQAGNYAFTVFVKDTADSSINRLTNITVANINRAPQFTQTLPETTFAVPGQAINFLFAGTDPDNDNLTFSLVEAPSGATLTSLGNFSWIPTAAQAGTHRIIVNLADGSISVRDTSYFRIILSNTAPFFTSVISDTTIKEADSLSFLYTASDTENDSILFSLVSQPVAGLTVSKSGLLTWTPNFNQAGVYTVIVSVNDKQFSVYDTAKITVVNVNRAPVFVAKLPDAVIGVDSLLLFKYSAADPDNDNLTFSLVQSPSGAAIQSDGTFSWKPALQHIGKDTIIVSVNDGIVSVPDTALLTVIGLPFAEVSQTVFDFGSITFGGTKTLKTIIKNSGVVPLIFRALPQSNLPPDPNFILDTVGTSFILPGQQDTISITYSPKTVGGHFTGYVFTTNDIRSPEYTFIASGSAIATLAVTKRVLVDVQHNSTAALTDTVNGMGQLFSFLTKSGIKVTYSGPVLQPHGHDILLLVTPQKNYSKAETDSINTFVKNGGLLIALGNSVQEGNNDALNFLLKDTIWTTNLSLNNDIVMDSSSNFLTPFSPLLTTFADGKHPFLTNVDTLVFFASSSINVSGPAVPLVTTTSLGRTFSTPGTVKPAVVGLNKVGKGKILVVGDADAWRLDLKNDAVPPNISIKDNLAFVLNVLSITEDYEVKMPAKTPNERYQLISIPFDLENSNIKSVLKGLGDPNPLIWRLFGRYDPATNKYAEFPSEKFNSFRRGEAYWLITRGEFDLTPGNATIVPVQNFFPIKIGPGYSIIGNPFPYRVSWKHSIHDSVQNVIWGYNGTTFFAESLAMEPFTGYFVKNLTKDSITIYINPQDITNTNLGKNSAVASSMNEGEWKVGISAVSGKTSDADNFAGIAAGAKEEFDTYDVAEPPPTPTDYVIVRFPNRHWQQHPGSYAMDIRAANDDGLYWDFEVITSKVQSRVDLSLKEFGDIPSSFSLYLVDKATERAVPLSSSHQYQFTMMKNETTRNFRLIAGRTEFIEKNTQGIPLVALDYALMQNYPNPFNPSTQIRYVIGHSGHVTLEIYNVLGQRVRSLRNEFQTIGAYSLEWDGKDDSGITVSTGIYFYKVQITSNGGKIFTDTKKMVLMK